MVLFCPPLFQVTVHNIPAIPPNFSLLLLLPLNPQWRLGVSHLPSAAAIQSSFTSLICCITHICPSERLSSLFLLLLFLLLKPLVLVLSLPMKINVFTGPSPRKPGTGTWSAWGSRLGVRISIFPVWAHQHCCEVQSRSTLLEEWQVVMGRLGL